LAARPKTEGDAIADGDAGNLRANPIDDPRTLTAGQAGMFESRQLMSVWHSPTAIIRTSTSSARG
jgi:hypothetical protein